MSRLGLDLDLKWIYMCFQHSYRLPGLLTMGNSGKQIIKYSMQSYHSSLNLFIWYEDSWSRQSVRILPHSMSFKNSLEAKRTTFDSYSSRQVCLARTLQSLSTHPFLSPMACNGHTKSNIICPKTLLNGHMRPWHSVIGLRACKLR